MVIVGLLLFLEVIRMAFENVGSILRVGSIASSLKLLLIAASSSRPQYRPLCMGLLKPFAKHGEVPLHYRCYGRDVQCFVRLSDIPSDLRAILDLCLQDTYDLDLNFHPDLVIDGGANIGLFTLRMAAAASATGDTPVNFVVCEPLPRNIEQLQKHLEVNQIHADLKAGCLGGESGSIPFYCRDAISSSFDPQKPYDSVVDMKVYRLQDVIDPYDAKRILIKLDIEGMEMEVLRNYVPGEKRSVYLVGELHNYAENASAFEKIFRDSGWEFQYRDITPSHATFRAYSPAVHAQAQAA